VKLISAWLPFSQSIDVRIVEPSTIQTPRRRETGRPPTAQFALRQLSISRWKCDKVRERGDARVELMTADLISRARAGDGDAFREVTEPYRR
jgi:hypothetical protein